MFANRFTAFIDACALAGALKRNLLLSLAEAEFFRIRWSEKVLEETQLAISGILSAKGVGDHDERSKRARAFMERAFADAMVTDYARFEAACVGLPDDNDIHVLAAALKTQASVIVTDNIRHFPDAILAPLNIEARTTDAFLANTISLDTGKSVAAVRQMRERLQNPEKSAATILLDMEAAGLVEAADALRPHVLSL